MMVIQGILAESRQHYQNQYDYALGRLILIPKGSLKKKKTPQNAYWYLRRHLKNKGYADTYIGPDSSKAVQNFLGFARERAERLDEFKTIKAALKQLGVKNMEFEKKGYPDIFKSLVNEFGKVGLWDEGLVLIGSWCFNVYVQAFDVEFFPLRTMDFDFGLRIPFEGDKADIDDILKRLGFTAQIDMAYDQVNYVMPGIGIVEVFVDRHKASDEQIKRVKQNLSLRPVVLSFLDMLIDDPVTIKLHGLHKAIVVPSMPSFFIHKLITAKFGEQRKRTLEHYKIRKDYKQAALVGKRIFEEKALRVKLQTQITALSKDLSEKMAESAKTAADFIQGPDLSVDDVSIIQQLSATEKNIR
jgi:hypothetical protein